MDWNAYDRSELIHHDPAPVLSELYGLNGVSRFSLVDGDDQLLWESRFAPPEPDYYRARLAMMSRRPTPTSSRNWRSMRSRRTTRRAPTA